MNMPAVGKIERSPSIERLGQIERDNYARERKGYVFLTDNRSVSKTIMLREWYLLLRSS